MSFLTVLLAILVERFVPDISRYRNETWYQKSFALIEGRIPQRDSLAGMGLALAAVLAPALLVAGMFWLLAESSGAVAFVAGGVVLIFMLGPESLLADIHRYGIAVRADDEPGMAEIAEKILDTAPAADRRTRNRQVISRFLVLAGRRLFSVIFWFVLLGPAGAVMFRAAEILRQRAKDYAGCELTHSAAQKLYGVLEWAPSRLLAGTYALAGSFDEAVAERRAYYAECSGRFFEINEDLLACTGRGALSFGETGEQLADDIDALENLMFRSLVVWLSAVALLMLIGWY